VNIGSRQHGRERSKNVIDVDYDMQTIINAIRSQLDNGKYKPDYLYGDGLSSSKIVEVLKHSELVRQKTITY